MMYICGYDISDVKRIKNAAKYMEQIAVRIQKSVFLFKESSKCRVEEVFKKMEYLTGQEDSFFIIPVQANTKQRTLMKGLKENEFIWSDEYIIL